MTRRKQQHFLTNANSDYVIERDKPLYKTIKGNWNPYYFKAERPITLELACGKGEYTIGLAKEFPNRHFIGVDIKGDRIARGVRQAVGHGLQNVAFLRTDIRYLDEFFEPGEVDEIWITFPDPQLRPKQEKHRLTHPDFLQIYKRLLRIGGTLHLKTDSRLFFDYSLQTLQQVGFIDFQYTHDLYQSPLHVLHQGIYTNYEFIFVNKGFTINYLQCKTDV